MSEPDLRRLSLNHATTQNWGMAETIDGCAQREIAWIGLWRHKVAEIGLAATAQLMRSAGVRASSLCRGGFFPAATHAEWLARIDDNRRAIDEAAELGAPVLVLVCGPALDRDLDAARGQVEEGICAILPYAAERSVRLAIEPRDARETVDRDLGRVAQQSRRPILPDREPEQLGALIQEPRGGRAGKPRVGRQIVGAFNA